MKRAPTTRPLSRRPALKRLRRTLLAWAGAFLLLAAGHLCPAQRLGDVLTPQQTEDLRDAADQPVKKLGLYVGYLNDRLTELHQLSPNAANAEARIHRLYEEFTSISDELEDNMDAYDMQHADERKALKPLLEKSASWTQALKEPKDDPAYDFTRMEALDACQSVRDDAQEILDEQAKYFSRQNQKKNKS